MFLGTFEHTLDAKGRLVMPRKFRDKLEAGCTSLPGQEGCLAVWTPDALDRNTTGSPAFPPPTAKARKFRRAFLGAGTEVVPDKQGRVPIARPAQGVGPDREERHRPRLRARSSRSGHRCMARQRRKSPTSTSRTSSHRSAPAVKSYDPPRNDNTRNGSGPRSVPRMPIGRPLTPPASILAPALRGADHGSEPIPPARNGERGRRASATDLAAADSRRHLWGRGTHSSIAGGVPGSQSGGRSTRIPTR